MRRCSGRERRKERRKELTDERESVSIRRESDVVNPSSRGRSPFSTESVERKLGSPDISLRSVGSRRSE